MLLALLGLGPSTELGKLLEPTMPLVGLASSKAAEGARKKAAGVSRCRREH